MTTDPEALCADPEVDAVIIATPNFTHRPIVLAAARGGKHVMCEKPLGLNAGEVGEMYHAVRDAELVHMTAFTYRFAPSMRYLKHLVGSGALGEPRHFRSQRFLDWPETSWGWRQYKDKAGAGDLFDMTIHRIDFAQDLLGPIESLCGAVARFAPRTRTADGGVCPPSDVDDWSSIIGAVSARERPASGKGPRWQRGMAATATATNGPKSTAREASAVYRLHEPNTILLGRTGHDLAPVDVPAELLKPAGSPRNPAEGSPATVFRYDLVWEFVSAIVERREAVPSFYEGLLAQIVADAVLAVVCRAKMGRNSGRSTLGWAGKKWLRGPSETSPRRHTG